MEKLTQHCRTFERRSRFGCWWRLLVVAPGRAVPSGLIPKCARVRMPFRPHRADLLETMRKERTPTFLFSLRKSYVTRDATTTIIQHRSSVANLDDDIQIGSAVSPSGGERGKWAVVSRLGQWQRCDCGRKFHVRYGFVHWRACADRWPLDCLHLCFASVSLDLQS